MSFERTALRTALSMLLLTGFIGLSACATRPPASDPAALSAYQRANDPLEPMNRATFKFNMGFDKLIMRPIAITYRTIVPKFIRTAMTHFLDNLSSPFILANDLLQGKPERGAVTIMRFISNTTVGIGGLMDPATKWGWQKHTSDLGQTLGVWGVGEGVYLVLPFVGPSNPRDAFGLAGEFYGDPTSLYIDHEYGKKWNYARTGMEILDFRTDNLGTLDELKANSTDYYAAMRSAYRQNRAYRINYGKTPIPAAKDDPFATEMDSGDISGHDAGSDLNTAPVEQNKTQAPEKAGDGGP